MAVLAVVAALATLVLAAPASAQDELPPELLTIINVRPDGKTVFESPAPLNFGASGDGYVAIGLADMFDVCTGVLPTHARGMYFTRPNGTYVIKTLPGGADVRVNVYRTELGVFDFFDQVCGSFFQSGTPIPAPFAVGIVNMRAKFWNMPELPFGSPTLAPGTRSRQSLSGTVADADGNLYTLDTFINFRIRGNGDLAPTANRVSVTPLPD